MDCSQLLAEICQTSGLFPNPGWDLPFNWTFEVPGCDLPSKRPVSSSWVGSARQVASVQLLGEMCSGTGLLKLLGGVCQVSPLSESWLGSARQLDPFQLLAGTYRATGVFSMPNWVLPGRWPLSHYLLGPTSQMDSFIQLAGSCQSNGVIHPTDWDLSGTGVLYVTCWNLPGKWTLSISWLGSVKQVESFQILAGISQASGLFPSLDWDLPGK